MTSDHVSVAGALTDISLNITDRQGQGTKPMLLHLKRQRVSALRVILSLAVIFAVLGFAAPSAHAQSGRSVARTHSSGGPSHFVQSFHGNADRPDEGGSGDYGGPPSVPPRGLWYYTGGSMYAVDLPGDNIVWRYDNWNGEGGAVYYWNSTGWHYWGTWTKTGTFSASPFSETDEQQPISAIEWGIPAGIACEERTPLAA